MTTTRHEGHHMKIMLALTTAAATLLLATPAHAMPVDPPAPRPIIMHYVWADGADCWYFPDGSGTCYTSEGAQAYDSFSAEGDDGSDWSDFCDFVDPTASFFRDC